MCELPCLVGKLSIVSHTTCPWQQELQELCSSVQSPSFCKTLSSFCFLPIPLPLNPLFSKPFFYSSFPCFLSYLLLFILYPTDPLRLSYSHHLSLSLPLSLCIILSVPLSAVSCVGRVAGQSSLISLPFFSLCGTYERGCNNQRSSVMTSNFPCLGSSSTRRRSVCVIRVPLFIPRA